MTIYNKTGYHYYNGTEFASIELLRETLHLTPEQENAIRKSTIERRQFHNGVGSFTVYSVAEVRSLLESLK